MTEYSVNNPWLPGMSDADKDATKAVQQAPFAFVNRAINHKAFSDAVSSMPVSSNIEYRGSDAIQGKADDLSDLREELERKYDPPRDPTAKTRKQSTVKRVK